MRKKKRENARQEQDGAKQCKMSNTSDRNMQNVYAKLAEARKKKADLDRLKHNASSRKCYNKKKKSKAPKASKKALSNGADEALKSCPPPKKQEVCGNADSGDEPSELLVRPGDEVQ
jgi:hypothetical protein